MKRPHFAALVVIGLAACNNGSQQSQPAPAGSSGSLQIAEATSNTDSAATMRVLSESEADSLLQLQQKIMQQPNDIALRRELGRRAIDANAGIIWAVGKGWINPNATTPNVALNQAKLAATLDAARWAAYLLEWQNSDYAADFGKIQARVPGVKVVREAMTDSVCIVLAQVPMQ